MGQTNQCCQSPFTDHKKFDLNQVKIYWPQVAQQIIMLRKINAHQISLKTHQQKIINENKQNQQLKSNKRVYKQFITSSHCFFGYISNDQNDSKTQYQQTPTNISSKNKPYFKSTRSSIKNKQNQSNLSFLPSIYKLNDFAILIHKDKACYMGNFKDSLFHGKGILHSLETNDRFDGIFEYGQRVNGKYENNEIKYTGTFKNNQLSGKGKLQYKKTNDIYEGEIHHGKMHGKGRIIYSSGDVYQGHFSNGIYHGEGIYYWSSGEIYKGSYKKGIKHGFGIMTIDGKSHELCWVNGKAEGKPMNYQEFQLKSKKQIKVAKTRQDLTKQEKIKEKQYEEDQDEVTSIIMNHHRIIKTQSYLY